MAQQLGRWRQGTDAQACIAGGIVYMQIPEHIKRFFDRKTDTSVKSVDGELERIHLYK